MTRSLPALLATATLAAVTAVGAPVASAAVAGPAARTVFTTGSQVVAAMTIARDGRVFYVGPGSGKIFVWTPSTRRTTTFASVPQGNGGYGLALSPTFASDHFLYAYMAVGTHEKVVRYTASGGVGTAYRALRDVGPKGSEHTGGTLVFSPNGRNLFVVVGDGGDSTTSQDPTVDHGKILRLDALGRPAAGNPGYADRAVWTIGHRNSIGMAFDPSTAHLWEAENGPECNDEINSISGGRNYGWGPHEVCDGTPHGTNQDGPSPTLPAETIDPGTAPTGLTFCTGCGLPKAAGKLVYGAYKTNELRVVTFDSTRATVLRDETLFVNGSSPLSVVSSPADGSIWFSDLSGAVKRLRYTT